jgi:predicted RNA-binding protein
MAGENMMNENELKNLVGKKVQINYINPADTEDNAAGRLVDVTEDLILIDGAVMKTRLYRKHIKIVSVDYFEEQDNGAMKLIIRARKKMTPNDWKTIGSLINEGQVSSKNKPRGVDWELILWSPGDLEKTIIRL